MKYYIRLPGFPQLGRIEVDVEAAIEPPPVVEPPPPPVVEPPPPPVVEPPPPPVAEPPPPPVAEPPPPPVVEPPPPPPSSTVLPQHPRMLLRGPEMGRILANINNCRLLWQKVITAAESSVPSADRMLCAAAVWQIGCIGQFVYRDSRDSYGARAVLDLMAHQGPVFGDQDSAACLAVPLAYDWIYELLQPENARQVAKRIEEAIQPHDSKVVEMAWRGYNQWGGNGMVGAIAIHGEVATDYVSMYRDLNWGRKHKHFLSYRDAREQYPDGGYHEGIHYLPRCWSNFIAKAAYESATGDRSTLDIGFFYNNSLWQLNSIYPFSPEASGQPFRLLNRYNYGGHPSVGFGHQVELQCSTSYPGQSGKLSRWMLDRMAGYSGTRIPTAVALLSAILVGDSGTPPCHPSVFSNVMNVPMDKPGEVLWRSSWSPLATLMSFACHRISNRLITAGDFMLAHAGKLVTGNRDCTYGHSYGEPWYRNHITFWEGEKIVLAPRGLLRSEDATFMASLDGQGYESECAKRYRDPRVELVRRTVDMRFAERGDFEVEDTVKCVPTLTPRIAWNMPLIPELTESGFITRNGGVSCAVDISGAAKITVVGGRETMTGPDYGNFNLPSWSEEARIQMGGYYTVLVDLPPGGGTVIAGFRILP